MGSKGSGQPSGTDGGSPLLERATEMAALEEALERAAGGIGSMLLIEGPAGIGKTRVLAAGRDSALALGFAVRTARGGPL